MQASSLKFPIGEMQEAMFPNDDLDAILNAWLEEARAYTSREAAQIRWVYYRGYNAVANRIAATPSSEASQGGHSVSWSDSRIEQFRKLADLHLSEYQRLTSADVLDGKVQAKLTVF